MDPFREAVLAHLQTADYPSTLKKKPAAIVAQVAESLQRVVAASMDDEVEVSLGSSKVGGLPHAPTGFRWPHENNTEDPLALVCQINLAEVGPCSDGQLPDKGMLYLFSIYDSDRAYGNEIDYETARLIHLPDATELAVQKRPEALDPKKGVFEEMRLLFGSSFICEEVDAEGRPASKRFDNAIERALDRAIVAAGGAAGGTRMLGRPHFFREENIEHYDPDDILLLEIDGYSVARHAFGEGGFLITISTADLAAGDLSKGWIIFEPGT